MKFVDYILALFCLLILLTIAGCNSSHMPASAEYSEKNAELTARLGQMLASKFPEDQAIAQFAQEATSHAYKSAVWVPPFANKDSIFAGMDMSTTGLGGLALGALLGWLRQSKETRKRDEKLIQADRKRLAELQPEEAKKEL